MKKIVSSFLAVALIFALLPMGVFDFSVKAATQGDYTYEIKNGGAVITGAGYSIGTEAIIPDTLGGYPVTEIGSNAFEDCDWLEKVVFPDSVKKLNPYIFQKLKNLKSVTLGSGLETISANAFAKCYGLTSITIPASVTSIGASAFTHCTALETVVFEGKVTNLPERVFYSCKALKNITIPEEITNIGSYAFAYCEALQKVDIPDSVKRIENYAFYYCSSLEDVTFGTGVVHIGTSAFSGCSAIKSIIIPDNVETIAAGAFNSSSSVTEIKIGKGVSSIGLNAFSSKSLTGFDVDENNQNYCSVDGVLFDKNKQTLIVYPRAKANTTYTIPDTVKKVESNAFSSCTNLKSVTIPDSVKTISDNAFSSCSNLESVVIPDSVTSVGNSAFSGCTSAESITIGSGVQTLGEKVFLGCDAIKSIVIPDSVTSVGASAFANCDNLESVKTGDGLFQISEYMFQLCPSLKNVEIGSGVQVIDTYAFSDCNSLENIVIPNSVQSIGKNAFSGCSGLVSITVPFVGNKADASGETYFGYIFGASNCDNNEWYVPASLEEVVITGGGIISGTAFKKCKNITKVVIKEGVTSISEGAFNSCTALESVVLHQGVSSIENYAFYKCTSLKEISFPYSMQKVAANAFNGCTALESVYYRGVKVANVTVGGGNDALVNAKWYVTSCIGTYIHAYGPYCGDACTVCGEKQFASHSYVETKVPPTETEAGYNEFVCEKCGYSYREIFKGVKVYGVKVETTDVDVTVSWYNMESAERYIVKALNPDGSTFNTRTITDGSNMTVFKNLEYDTEYTFFVIARIDGKWQSADDADQIKGSLVLGNRVVGIKSSVKGRTITVNWKEYPGADRYYVMVYPKGADPTDNSKRVTTVNAGNNTTANIINVIAPETIYDIYVSARVDGKYQSLDGALSTTQMIPVTAPSSFEITSIEPTIVRIKWNAVKNADRYWARIVDENGNTVKTRECAKALVSFTGLIPGKTYYVQLQARVPKSSGGNQYSGYCDPILTQPITLPL